ncbi:HPr family phosphocarrier protein [Paenibacillus athensensis]|uniref:HPr domain-containing protein n=1 Tax=Paenibacillus athensensis TaxID=1967502 RepID=A0A4Y8Q7H4_9BACL|nr:HPr family phosphocarrier protein [Paenibacillus athensensis]MCD1257363.1 HPr family phosphocarrier protein [Paenibacillus athensensis]
MLSKTFTIVNPSGFHARPTKLFVQKATTFPDCEIFLIKNQTKKMNGKSSLGILSLGIAHNDEITLEVSGERAEQAMEELGGILTAILE